MPLLISLMSAHAQSLDKGSVEGALFYKEHGFLDDKSAQIIEFHSSKTYDEVTYLETARGTHMRINNAQAAFVLCYPGRGQVGRQEALALADIAAARFPQYTQFIARVREAWEKMTPEEEKRQARESEIRHNFLSKVREEVGDASQYKGPPPPLEPSLLQDHRPGAKATPSVFGPAPTPVAAATPSADPGKKTEGGAVDLQQNIEAIKELSETLKAP